MTPKAARLADSDKGAAEVEALMTALEGPRWRPRGNGWEMSDQEWKDYVNRELAKGHEEDDARIEQWREAFITLQKVKRTLREFALAPVSISSLQPVLELAHELNPSLRDELNPEPNPFI
jgi:hypothetical protein